MSDGFGTRARITSASLACLGVVASMILGATPAHAATSTTTSIVTQGPVDVAFGDEWVVEVAVVNSSPQDSEAFWSGPIRPTDGTVDAFIAGMAEPFADDVPLQAGGRAYISQPDSQSLLAAGSHELTAVFTPAAGSDVTPSQTTTSITLNVSPLAIEPSFTVNSAADQLTTSVDLRLGGDYLESRNSAPPGLWNVAVTDPSGDRVFDSEVAQPTGAPQVLTVSIDAVLDPGTDYSVAAVFTPDPSIAGGVVVPELPVQSFTTPGSTFTDIVTSPVPVPMALSIVGGVVLAVLVASAVAITLVLRRRAKPLA